MQIVRNKRIPGRERPLRPFEGLYGLSQLFNLFLVSVAALFAVYSIVLVAVNFVSPKLLKDMDDVMTDKIVKELASGHNYESAIAMMDIALDSVQRSRIDNQFRLGICSEKTGMYSNAIEYYKRLKSLQIGEDYTIGIVHEFILSRLLCHVYITMGDMSRAEECQADMRELYGYTLKGPIEKYCEQISKELGRGFFDDYSWISLSPDYELALVNYQKAPKSSIETLSRLVSREINGGNLSVNTKLKFINTLIKWKLDNNDDALPEISMAIKLSDEAFYMDQFEQFGELASYCKRIGDDVHFNRLMSSYKRYLFNSHKKSDPEAISVVKYLVANERYYQADRLLDRICGNLRNKIRSNIPIMSDEQRELYVKTLEEPFAYTEELMVEHPSPRLAKISAENALFKKGLLLRSNRNQRLAIQSRNDRALLDEYEKLLSLRREYNIIKNLNRPEEVIRKSLIKKQIYQIDKRISETCANYVSEQLQSDMSVESLQKALGRHNTFVYFASNRKNKLFALQITKKNVTYIPIGEFTEDLDSALNNPDYCYNDEDITRNLLGNVSFSKKGKNIYYCSTSGKYNKIALPSLLVSGDRHMMDIADIRFISDPSLISRNREEDSRLPDVVSLWGGIKYSDNDKTDSIDTESHRAVKRGERLVYLKNSLSEVEGIVNVLTSADSNRYICNLYTGWNATEESFKARDGKGDYIIHISTHGYFKDTPRTLSFESAMDDSGLLFAGAEKYWQSDSTIVDIENEGILKASEIELMDLNGCQLVVLSACETGLGHDDNSEGVYGLQRAFKLAGTDHILMSLWEVPDKESSLLMQFFYSGLINGSTPNEALEFAQKKIRADNSSPESWGGFILLN